MEKLLTGDLITCTPANHDIGWFYIFKQPNRNTDLIQKKWTVGQINVTALHIIYIKSPTFYAAQRAGFNLICLQHTMRAPFII